MLTGFGLRRTANFTKRFQSSKSNNSLGFKSGLTFPNLCVTDNTSISLPIYSQLKRNPTVLVMHPLQTEPRLWLTTPDQLECDLRLAGYQKLYEEYQAQGINIVYLCPQMLWYNIPAEIQHFYQQPFPVLSATQYAMQDIEKLGHPMMSVDGIESGCPSTTLIAADKKVIGFRDKDINPKDDAEMTLEYLIKTKLFISEKEDKDKPLRVKSKI